MTRLQEIRHECLLQLYGSKEIPFPPTISTKWPGGRGRLFQQEIRNGLFFLRGQGFANSSSRPTGEARHRINQRRLIEWENMKTNPPNLPLPKRVTPLPRLPPQP